MNLPDNELDGELPKPNSTLSEWRWFAFRNIGDEAFEYMDLLCKRFGNDYEVEQDSLTFLNHLGWVSYTENRRKG